MSNKDIVIIGSGPAGISAAIYVKRAGFNPVVIEKNMPGGKVSMTHMINNYPGIASISGADLAMSFVNQLSENHINITFDEIISIEKRNETFEVKGRYDSYCANAVIVASGTQDKKMNIPGEKELFGKGISTCAVCDGQFFKGNPMAIVGGNSKALEEALYLSSITNKVYIINRHSSFDAEEILIEKVNNDTNIEILMNTIPLEIKGDNRVSGLLVENIDKKNQILLDVKAVFAYVGSDSNSSFIQNKEVFNEMGYIKVDSAMKTTVDGLFACGDCVDKKLRQIVTAASDGAIAAISAVNYLRK